MTAGPKMLRIKTVPMDRSNVRRWEKKTRSYRSAMTTDYSLGSTCVTSRKILLVAIAVLFGTLFSGTAQETEVVTSATSESAFEELPELSASGILKPEFLKGPHHTVREPVTTSSGANHYMIDSDFGLFEVDGNEMLVRRVGEIGAIAQLKEVSRTDQFKKSLVTAVKSPLAAAKNIVTDPINTISNVPKGVMKFMGRAGQTLKGIGKKGSSSEKDPEGSKMQQMIGYSDAKRKAAKTLGVDPYSTNVVLQKELDGIAWASWAGGFAFTAATLPIGGAAGAALTVTNASSTLDSLVHEKSPDDLKAINRNSLKAMGASDGLADRLLNNGAFSPSQVTAFVLNLKSLAGVANRTAFIRAAAEQSSTETDALFCVQTAALLGQINKDQKPLARIAMIENFPLGIAKDGTVIVALQWDYAAWTSGAAFFTGEVEKLAHESGEKKPVLIAVSGQMSPRLHQELQSRGFQVEERVTPGPLQ